MPASLMLHCGAEGVSRAKLGKLPTPKPMGSRHAPLPHHRFVELVTDAVAGHGLTIAEEKFGLTKDHGRFFGTMTLEGRHCGSKKAGAQLMLGLRNSHTQEYAAAICTGNKVVVCDNLAFRGEHVLKRKNTAEAEADLATMIADLVGKAPAEFADDLTRITAWRAAELDTPQVHDLLMTAYRREITPLSRLANVLELWDNPPHKAFAPRTAWSLFNAFTEDQKELFQRSPFDATDRSIRLSNLFAERFSPSNN